MTAPLSPIRRPNGRLYRPRRLVTHSWEDHWRGVVGVLILGTHDPGRVRALAEEACLYWHGQHAGVVTLGWWRDGYVADHELGWVYDEVSGRAGISFTGQDTPWRPRPGPADVWLRLDLIGRKRVDVELPAWESAGWEPDTAEGALEIARTVADAEGDG